MGRRRSNYICPRCGKRGFRRKNPDSVVHYDHATRTRKTCRLKVSTEDPPTKFWGESELYSKLDGMATHLHSIAQQLDKVKMQVYKFRPDPDTSAQCVKYLDVFDKQFLNPIEKLLSPYYDLRWNTTWPHWFKIQMDSLQHGPRAAAMMNAIDTGEYVLKEYKDGHKELVGRMIGHTATQIKKKQKQTLQFATEVLASHPLEMALRHWLDNTNLVEIMNKDEE